MSRSYRKNPIVKDGKRRRKWVKNQANRRVRHATDVPNGGGYRKLYPQWDVCDTWDYCTLKDWLHLAEPFDHRFYRWGRFYPDQSWRKKYFTAKNWKKYFYWK